MKKPVKKIIVQIIFFELLFIFLVKTGLTFLQHRQVDLVYYAHVNLYFLIACFSFLNYLHSKLNRAMILVFFISAAMFPILTLYNYFAWPYFQSLTVEYFSFNLTSMGVNTAQLFISIYLLVYIFQPRKGYLFHMLTSLFTSLLIAVVIYYAYFSDGLIYNHPDTISPIYNNRIFFVNFSILLLFWYEYSKQKHNLSEYLINIIVLFTIIIGMEILHIFNIKSDVDVFGNFHNIGQYFTAILNFLILIVWILRLSYLHSPYSKENEHFIKNYNVLYGFMEKPRTGYVEGIYQRVNPRFIWLFVLLSCIICVLLVVFNHLNLFVKKNVLLLTISLVISAGLAILYWNKRWYQAIEFLIKKKKKINDSN